MNIERIKQAIQGPTPAPLHQKLRDAIYEQIADGTLPAGETLPSERALKDFLGLSRATVRQAINTLIQDGFLQSIAGTGTFVLEQATKPSVRGLIGLISSSPNFNFFYPQLTAAFNERIRRAGYGLVMSLHSEQSDTLEQMVDELLAQNVVAFAITPPRYGDLRPLLTRLRRQHIPLVFVGRNAGIKGVHIVATDNESIGYEATRYLLNLGHQHIAYIGLLDYSTGNERAAGYQRAMQEAQLPPHIVQLNEEAALQEREPLGAPREHLAAPAQDAAYQLWGHASKNSQATAAFCFNDIVAMGVYKALRDLKIHIPEEVSLVSVDNLISVRHFEVPLSTFALPGEAIGVQSAEILLRELNGEAPPSQTIFLPADFVERASAGKA